MQKDGYTAKAHKITTSDGYILHLHHIENNTSTSNETIRKPVVFLMHGLLETASSWIALGPEFSLGRMKTKKYEWLKVFYTFVFLSLKAYLLHDNGFDVWMGNCRGTRLL